ncbi:MAG: MFS transporter [Pikeienuella sp.]
MTRAEFGGVVAAIAAITIFSFGMSLSIPLFAIVLERMGLQGWMIGLNGSASALAMTLGGAILPIILRRTNVPNMIIWAVVIMAALLIIMPLIPNPWVWFVLRFVFGFAGICMFFCSEIWIVTTTPEKTKGKWIGIYGLFLSIGFLAGPTLLRIVGTEGLTPFLIGAAIVSIALIPVILARKAGRELPRDGADDTPFKPLAVFSYFKSDPAVMGAVFLFGVVEFGCMGLIPVWSVRNGLPEQTALLLVALLAAGNLITNVPMGLISDRFDRRKILLVCSIFCLLAAFAMPALARETWPLWIVTAFWGGLAVGLYVIALHEMGARYSGAAFARANAAFMTAYGGGALVSPLLMGAALDLWPPHGMFFVLGGASLAYIALLTLRRRPRAG